MIYFFYLVFNKAQMENILDKGDLNFTIVFRNLICNVRINTALVKIQEIFNTLDYSIL